MIEKEITEKMQKRFIEQFYIEPSKRDHKIKSMTHVYLKNANIYYGILISGTITYLLDRELDLVAKLGHVINFAIRLVPSNLRGSSKGLAALRDWLMQDWDFSSYISMFFFGLIFGFICLNLLDTLLAARAQHLREEKVENQRAHKSTCLKVSPEKYEQETRSFTRKALDKLKRSAEYKKHMETRGEFINW